MIDKKELGLSIKQVRLDYKIEMDEYACILDVSKRSLRNIENGISIPSLKTIINLCNYFSLNIDEFLKLKYLQK